MLLEVTLISTGGPWNTTSNTEDGKIPTLGSPAHVMEKFDGASAILPSLATSCHASVVSTG